MKQRVFRAYRRWQRLNHEGLNEDDFVGLRKFERAKAIGILVAALPMLPLIISDEFGFERGWLWLAWSIVAAIWAVGIVGLIVWNSGRSIAAYVRHWRAKRK